MITNSSSSNSMMNFMRSALILEKMLKLSEKNS